MLLQLKIDQVCQTNTGLTAYYTIDDNNLVTIVHIKRHNKVVQLKQSIMDLITSIIENNL